MRWIDSPPSGEPTQTDWSEILARLKMTIPTLRRVPKGARMEVARALTKILEEVTTTKTEDSWGRLFLFPYASLAVPQKTDKVKNLTTWFKSQVARWLLDQAAPPPRIARPPAKAPREMENVTKKVEAKLADGDIRGAIRLACSDDTIAPRSQETVDALFSKHPPHPEPTAYPEPLNNSEPPTVDPIEITTAISSFPPGSAGGLDSLRPQILKDLVATEQGEVGDKLIEAILNFTNFVLSGGVPAQFCPIFYGASLTALKKKTGGIRPVAVGNVWRRLSAKIALKRMSSDLVEYLAPHQLGVGVRGGAEAAAHAARIYWGFAHTTSKAFLKVDFNNAFNEIRRDTVLKIIHERFPSMFSFLSQAYSSPSQLFYGDTHISSRRGCQQGDPVGPALFALVVQPIILAIETELNLWYLDDATLADTPEKVLIALDTIIRMGEEVGLRLNTAKCEVGVLAADEHAHLEILERFRKAAPGIQEISPETAVLLGAPLTDESIEAVLGAKSDQLAKLGARLLELSSHSAFFLFRASISTPRLIYFLRCAPIWRRFDALTIYDAQLKSVMEGILNCSLSPQSWLQSSLPVSEGGLGVRHAVDVAIPCFLASAYSALPLVELLLPPYLQDTDVARQEGEERWNPMGPAELPPLEVRGAQAAWEMPQQEAAVNHLRSGATTPEEKARLLAMGFRPWGHGSTLSLHHNVGLYSPTRRSELLAPFVLAATCATLTNVHVERRALRSAGAPAIKEPPGCSRQDGKRPDGLTLIPWARGRPLVWDFTCSDTFAPSYLPQTCVHPGAAAEKAEDSKRKKYEFLQDRFLFVPVAIETIGVWGKEGLSLIKEIGSRITIDLFQPVADLLVWVSAPHREPHQRSLKLSAPHQQKPKTQRTTPRSTLGVVRGVVRCSQDEQPEKLEGDKKLFKCDQCGESFRRLSLLKAHKTKRTECFILPPDTLCCPVSLCGLPFPTRVKLRGHLVKDHATWQGACLICGVKPDCSIYDHLVQEHGSPGGPEVKTVRPVPVPDQNSIFGDDFSAATLGVWAPLRGCGGRNWAHGV
ncbi:Retrovirus-related Pol polyprotein from type-1 retrotransposable element R1 [Folsomia candida]|uniref:Retrovirus-related Pol polyprotein from type-1 retrotransposable element R1 n=1 Tax=Folsomia candida TaxID=158441 RepID=A0A226DV40_FOLCA|nr:Retrovirus-related Pol polyprotein from type-1 retrotransposable element R1 [Folsomia candida]